ncbi:MAG: hypothetical protein EHM72_16345 [Calditrichaeota bacterium]|nr:MAG: hypothetical protein EHM72_16345 [Calditrichota bacterium]
MAKNNYNEIISTVRKIRDQQSNDIIDKSPQEKIEYFRKKAMSIHNKAEFTKTASYKPIDSLSAE